MFLATGGLAYPAGLQSNRAAVRMIGTIACTATGWFCKESQLKPIKAEIRSTKNKDTDHLTGTTTMAADRAQNLQDTFLNHVRKTKTPLTIFLVNGVKLQGIVTWFDNFCLLLRRDGHSQLVYKHAISTIMPGAPIQLFEGGEDAPA
jgi:host factor-I protein